MIRKILPNGLAVILDKRLNDSVVVQVLVKIGSNNETSREAGLSHFLEHMVFEGTEGYENSEKLSSEIEKLGGDLNAATWNTKTHYFAKVPKRHIEKALEIISQLVLHPLLREPDFKKEQKIILDEINMITDQPLHYQWYFFLKNLFKKHPSKNPVFGTKSSIKSMTLNLLKAYYSRFYRLDNMTLVISGNFKDPMNKIKKYFGKKTKKTKRTAVKKIAEPKQKKKIAKEKRDIGQSYYVLGYKTAPRKDKDSYVLDIIRAVLARGQSGTLFNEIRGKRGLAYVLGINHDPDTDFGYFSFFCGTDKKNLNKITKIVMQEFKKIQDITKKQLAEAKTFIEGEFLLDNEDNEKRALNIAIWDLSAGIKAFDDYLKEIKKITLSDVKGVAKNYLTNNYVLIGIEQK